VQDARICWWRTGAVLGDRLAVILAHAPRRFLLAHLHMRPTRVVADDCPAVCPITRRHNPFTVELRSAVSPAAVASVRRAECPKRAGHQFYLFHPDWNPSTTASVQSSRRALAGRISTAIDVAPTSRIGMPFVLALPRTTH
jgi:hypothetical protein